MYPFIFFSGESSAIAGTVGNLSKSAEVMKLVNDLMKAPQMAAIMQEFGKEMTKVSSLVSLSLSLSFDHVCLSMMITRFTPLKHGITFFDT